MHENGSISTRIRRVSSWISSNSQDSKFHYLDSVSLSPRSNSEFGIGSDAIDNANGNPDESVNSWASPEDTIYDICHQTDSIRITKSCRVIGFGCSPITESDIMLLLSDGRLLKWRLMITSTSSTKSHLFDASIVDSDIFSNDKSMYNLALPQLNGMFYVANDTPSLIIYFI